ncbi:NfrA family protein [Vibrio pectenicida]|uniref:NfrA family protein n=2 Tax=Vibrio pectenicida TaxID=62763 RepID=UPI00308205F9
MKIIRYIKITIIVISLLTTPALDAVRDNTIDLASTLSDSAHFRTFPYLNRAFALERSDKTLEAITQVNRALNIAPKYHPFLRYLFKLQLRAKLFKEAEATLKDLPVHERIRLLVTLRSEMSIQSITLSNPDFMLLLDGLSLGSQKQVYLYRLYWLADQSETLSLEWSISQALSVKPDQAILYEAEAWLKRQNYQQVLDSINQIRDRRALSGREQYLVGLALLKSKRIEETISLLKESRGGSSGFLLAQQLISDFIHDQQYSRALMWYKWLEKYYVLTSEDYSQAFQLAINVGDWDLARSYQKKISNTSCTENALISARLGNRDLAKEQLASCSTFESPVLWLSLAEELNLTFMIESASFSGSRLVYRQSVVIAWNKYNQAEYQKVIDILSSMSLSIHSRKLLASAYDKNGEFRNSMLEWERVYNESDQLSDLKSLLEVMKKALTETQLISEFESLLSDGSLPSDIRKNLAEQLLYLYAKHPENFNPEIVMQLTDINIDSFCTANLWQINDGCRIAKEVLINPKTAFGWQVLGYCSYEESPERAIGYTDNALLLEKSATSRIDVMSIKAQMLFEQQRYQEVLNVLLPEWQQLRSPYIRLLVPSAYHQLGKYERARFWWGESDEKGILEWWSLGTDIYISQKKFDQAKGILEEAEKKFNHNPQFVIRYVKLYKSMGKKKNLIDYLSRQHQSSPDDVYITTELAYAYFPSEPERSVRLFESVVSKLKGDNQVMAYYQLAQGYKKIGRRDKAQSGYHELIDQLTTVPEKDSQLIEQLRAENRNADSNWQFVLSGESGGSSPFQELLEDSSNNGFYQVSASYQFEELPSLFGQMSLLSSGSFETTGIDFGGMLKPFQMFDLSISSGIRQYFGDDDFTSAYVRANGDFFSGLNWDKSWKGERRSSWSHSLYFDAFYQFYDERSLLYVRGESGPVWGITENYHQRIWAYGLLQASADMVGEENDSNLKTGFGVGWLSSFHYDRYLGYENEAEVVLEWQKKLNDYDQDELVLRFSLNY